LKGCLLIYYSSLDWKVRRFLIANCQTVGLIRSIIVGVSMSV
jgi:hypothetical protein